MGLASTETTAFPYGRAHDVDRPLTTSKTESLNGSHQLRSSSLFVSSLISDSPYPSWPGFVSGGSDNTFDSGMLSRLAMMDKE